MKKNRSLVLIVMLLVTAGSVVAQDSLNVRQAGLMHLYWGDAQSVTIVDTLAYVTTGGSGLSIVSIADPENPTEIGFSGTSDEARDVAVAGDYAYVCCGKRLIIIDITDPFSPMNVSSVSLSTSPAMAVAVSGRFAYVANLEGGLKIVEIVDSANPEIVGELVADWLGREVTATDITIAGNFAYVADFVADLWIVDISNPEFPIPVNNPYLTGDLVNASIAVSGDYAYTTVMDRLWIIYIADPAFQAIVSITELPWVAVDIAVSGDIAYIAGGTHGLAVMDISNPFQPVEIGFYDTPGYAQGVALSEIYAFVADEASGLRIVDVSDPSSPSEIGFYSVPGFSQDIAIAGDYVFSASGSRGLEVVDVSNPSQSVVAGHHNTYGIARAVAISENNAYVAVRDSGLRVFNIENPMIPTEEAYIDSIGNPCNVVVAGNYVYVASRIDGLRIIDATNPTLPVEVGFVDSIGDVYEVAVEGDYAYVTKGYTLDVIDISNPTIPTVVGSYDSPEWWIEDLHIAEGYMYQAVWGNWEDRIKILDIGNPTVPVEVGYAELEGATSVKVIGNFVYVADDNCIRILDVSIPSSPVEVGYYVNTWRPINIDVSGEYVFASNAYYLGIYDCSEALGISEGEHEAIPRSIMLYPSYPNPFNPTATIGFALPVAGDVSLTVYNALGQEVESLASGMMQPGAHVVTFDGSRFSSGSYFYTLKAGEFSETKKMVLIK